MQLTRMKARIREHDLGCAAGGRVALPDGGNIAFDGCEDGHDDGISCFPMLCQTDQGRPLGAAPQRTTASGPAARKGADSGEQRRWHRHDVTPAASFEWPLIRAVHSNSTTAKAAMPSPRPANPSS